MRTRIDLNKEWIFIADNKQIDVNIPHTWNAQGSSLVKYKGSATYIKKFNKPIELKDKCIYLIFDGVNSVCDVILNRMQIGHHEDGYSRFIIDITNQIQESNTLIVKVSNKTTDYIYPTTADFTFYGGIYRNVYLEICDKHHLKFNSYSSSPLKCTTSYANNIGHLNVCYTPAFKDDEVKIQIVNKDGLIIKEGYNKDFEINNPILWNGIENPYLYKVKASLYHGNTLCDEVIENIGFRSFKVDPINGFFLNDKPYPLRGVSKHQDRKDKGNAISYDDMEEDLELIKEIGANCIRLAHYQHDQHIYDLCDKYGIIIWTEIPYISKHSSNGFDNIKQQLQELILQNYNHPSVFFWGLSNEITMFKKEFNNNTIEEHKELNKIAHYLDPNRMTTIACYSAMLINNKIAHITDLASYNLYCGWYIPFTHLTSFILDLWHLFYPKSPIGLSEYGAEGMINLHSSHPKRFDDTEEYQCIYHEKMLKDITKRKYIWSTFVWNMFDFASEGRNTGGEEGINHKGLITFDRKIKKDSFYLYKAYWSKEPFIHICSKRYINRKERKTLIKIYSNLNELMIYKNDKYIKTIKGNKVFKFKLKLDTINNITVKSGSIEDSITINKVNKKDKSYILKKKSNNKSWQK